MKIGKNNFLILASVALVCNLAQANMLTASKPDKCPDVNIIRMVGLDANTIYEATAGWGVSQINNFGTQNSWIFTIDSLKATDAHEAYEMAKNLLASLEFTDGPTELGPRWTCHYRTSMGSNASALS